MTKTTEIYRLSLNSLARALLMAHRASGDRGLLDKSLRLQREALQLQPLGHTNYPDLLSNFGVSITSFLVPVLW